MRRGPAAVGQSLPSRSPDCRAVIVPSSPSAASLANAIDHTAGGSARVESCGGKELLLKRLFCLVPLVLLLACGETTTVDSSMDSVIRPSSVRMDAITSASIDVTSPGAWEVSSGAAWLTADPPSGTGDGTVVLTVDPSGLEPGSYTTTVSVAGSGEGDSVTVAFSFPRVRGAVRVGGQASASTLAVTNEVLPDAPGRLLVGLERSAPSREPGVSRQRFTEVARDVAAKTGAGLVAGHPRAGVAVYLVGSQRKAAAALARDPRVRYVEPDREVERLAVDTYRSLQWGLDKIDVDSAWTGATGAGVRVAVMDSGFRTDHPDLAANVWYAYDFGDERDTVESDNANCGAHGQHVAGIVAAVTDNGAGVAGVAPDAELWLLDVDTSTEGSCPIWVSSMVAALEWSAGDILLGRNADVMNMSLGLGAHVQSLQDAVAAAHAAGVTLIASAGNDPNARVIYPAAYPQVIAVSATGASDEIAAYSTTGPEVWVSAPGGNYRVSQADTVLSTIFTYSPTSYDYGYKQGTSMASPMVAGVAALVKSAGPKLGPCDIARVLAESSVDLGPAGRDEAYGYGRVDAARAVAIAATAGSGPCRWLLLAEGEPALEVPLDGAFDLGYFAPGSLALSAGSDENENGVFDESGEYYGELALQVGFDGPTGPVELVVERVP
jgi:subtilisin family serine protease